MRRTLLTAVAALALGASAFTNAAAGDGDRVYFTCTSMGPNTNAEVAVGSWSEEEPSGAMGSGNGGCFSFDLPVTGASNDNALYDTAWTGTYEGAIDSMTLHLYTGSLSGSTRFAVVISQGEEVLFDGMSGIEFEAVGDGPFPQTSAVEATLEGLRIKSGVDLTVKVATIAVNHEPGQDSAPAFIMYGASDAPAGITFNPA